ncbi:hypothetical protein QBC47DRAFT_15275 [Echria macrotheca]|uniref:cyclin-dependent kinase n=1 Tax=Echria macrotheca TaxID=438768 RepID=A0AAJ0BPX5_9PEZI|nr:hypothetical protein QBC47DRAFT_15275 [Echria macrotheca]
MDQELSAALAQAPHRRRHDAAMPNGNHDTRDPPRRHISENDLGMTTTHRSSSPAAAAVNRSQDTPRERGRERDLSHHHQSHHRHRRDASRERSEPSRSHHQRRRHSRHRSPDHSARPSRASDRAGAGHRDRSREPPPRRHGLDRSPDRRHPDSAAARPREHEPSHQDRSSRRDRSPSSGKRPRSPDPSLSGLQSKKSRPDHSPPGLPRLETLEDRLSRRRNNLLQSRRRSRSPESRDRRSKQKRARSRSPSPRRHRPRSPSDSVPVPRRQSRPRKRSTSPRGRAASPREARRRSRSRRRTPPQWGDRPPTSSGVGSGRRQNLDSNAYASTGLQTGSPRDRRGPPEAEKRDRPRDGARRNSSDPASGANSIDVNMAARGGFRGGFNSQPPQPGYPPKGPYGQTYAQSSGHGTPNSSFHASPPIQSPYPGGGRGWNPQPHFSPQRSGVFHPKLRPIANRSNSQFSPPYQPANFGPPTGPQAHFHPNQAHSPPYPPNGPSSSYPQGPYRGGHRGGPSGFRGSQFGPGRGGYRGGFKNIQWNANSQNAGSRAPSGSGEEADASHASGHSSPKNAPQGPAVQEDVQMTESENPFRPSKDLQVEDTSKPEASTEGQPPPSRAPPTGPQSQTTNKFSFSMKNASKPAVTAPRPEISSKFNATPAPREIPQKPAAQKPPPPKPERDRGFPRNPPTEPASARARPAERRPPEPSRPADQTPKTRKVKKVMKRLKDKPKLPVDLAKSASVYFRKPGNESVIGSGTYGKVFKGVNVYTKNRVALKRIRMEGERDGFPVTAVREVKLLRSLCHKNIVQLQEVMVEANECFMVFEYLSHDLTGLLNHPNYTLDPAQRKHLALQLFQGLDYLHTRGVLHRDIKAANILVSNEGILKLADFGLARFYAKHHQLDYTNRVITIWYRSPELLLGETRYGPAVDIWSAACVMMEIFTGRAIFPGDGTEINQLEKIFSMLGTPSKSTWPGFVEMPWFQLLRPTTRKPNLFADTYKDQLTPAAFDLLTSMFHFDPAKRPTAAEVLKHEYFITEQPAPRQAIELKNVDGEWHEFESKALRRENERKEKEARRALKEAASGNSRDKDRKRPNDSNDGHRESKRPHVEGDGKSQRPEQNPQPARVENREAQARPPKTSQMIVGGQSKPERPSNMPGVPPGR